MTDLYKRVELKEGEPVQFLAVYVLRWQQEWGEPYCGFVENEESTSDVIELKEKLTEAKNGITKALQAIDETTIRRAIEYLEYTLRILQE